MEPIQTHAFRWGIIKFVTPRHLRSSVGKRTDDPLLIMLQRGKKLHDVAENVTIKDLFTKSFWSTVVIDSSMGFYVWWSIVVSIMVLYNVVIIPPLIIFQVQRELLNELLVLDVTGDCIYVLDMILSSRLGFIEDGKFVYDIKRLRKNYLFSLRFFLDFIAILPAYAIWFLFPTNHYLKIFRLNRLLKIWRMYQCFQLIHTMSLHAYYARIFILFVVIIVVLQCNACIFYSLIWYDEGVWWVPRVLIKGPGEEFVFFAYSLWWSLRTTGGISTLTKPLSDLGLLLTIISTVMGEVLIATMFANIGALIVNLDLRKIAFFEQVDAIKHYMKTKRVHSNLQTRILQWLLYIWHQHHYLDEEAVFLEELQSNLRDEVAIDLHLAELKRVRIFQNCEVGMLKELVKKLKLRVFSPGDYVCQKGNIGEQMFIVSKGHLQVLSDDNVVFGVLKEGAVFGELSLLDIPGNTTMNKRTASVRSLGYADLFALSKNDLLETLESFSGVKEQLVQQAQEILKKDNLFDDALVDEAVSASIETRIDKMTNQLQELGESVSFIMKWVLEVEDKISRLNEIPT